LRAAVIIAVFAFVFEPVDRLNNNPIKTHTSQPEGVLKQFPGYTLEPF
jgi:exosortase/archaeosortase